MKTRPQFISVVLSYVLLAILLMTTNPESMPLPVIIIPFIVIFICLFLTIDLVAGHLLKNINTKSRVRISIILAIFPVLIMVLQSINQLTLRDVAISLLLFFLLIFYFKKTNTIK